MQSTSRTLLAVMQRNNSRRRKCPSWSVSLTGMPYSRHSLDRQGRSESFYLAVSLMMKGRNNGKKLLTVRIVAHAFEIIHLLTDQNPIQVRARGEGVWRVVLMGLCDRCSWTRSSTRVLEKTRLVLGRRGRSGVRPWMCPRCGE